MDTGNDSHSAHRFTQGFTKLNGHVHIARLYFLFAFLAHSSHSDQKRHRGTVIISETELSLSFHDDYFDFRQPVLKNELHIFTKKNTCKSDCK